MPYADNDIENLTIDSRENSFIEINTSDDVHSMYVTDETEIITANEVKYIKVI